MGGRARSGIWSKREMRPVVTSRFARRESLIHPTLSQLGHARISTPPHPSPITPRTAHDTPECFLLDPTPSPLRHPTPPTMPRPFPPHPASPKPPPVPDPFSITGRWGCRKPLCSCLLPPPPCSGISLTPWLGGPQTPLGRPPPYPIPDPDLSLTYLWGDRTPLWGGPAGSPPDTRGS